MSQSDAASEADDEQPISGEIQYGSPPRRYGLIIVAMLACIAVAWTTKEVVGSHHAKMDRVPTDAIALFSDKMKASADNEPAWNGAGQKVGLQIWRIINFKVVAVPKDDYGEFYEGDSYLVLNTYEKDGDFQFDIHFWLGKYSTQDEFGTAAYKAVELDTKLDDRAFTHREVMNHESSLFKSYFDSMKIVKGGADSGFRGKVQKDIETRLWVATKNEMREVRTTSSLKSENVYAIQHGDVLYQWNGAKAHSTFKWVAATFCKQLLRSNPRTKITVLEERQTTANHPAMLLLQQEGKNAKSGPATLPSKMLRLTASLDLEVLSGLDETNLKTEDVVFVDTAEIYWIWVGKGASVRLRGSCMAYANKEVSKSEAKYRAIRLIQEGEETDEFRKVFTNA